MRKRKIILFIFILLISFSPVKFLCGIAKAQSSPNVGFASANIRYSKDPFLDGDKIKIYTLVINPDSKEISGTVIFFDKTTFLGTKNFIVPANGVKDIFIDWTVTAGDHLIYGKIENAKFLISKGKYEDILLTENETEKSERTVEKIIKIVITPDSNTNDTVDNSSIGAIQNIQKIIAEKTPDFIAKPISMTASAIDGFREYMGTNSANKKETTKTEIKTLDNNSTSAENSTTSNLNKSKFLKPFKYVELFFLTLSSAIFNNKLIFYSLLGAIVFFLVRFIWHKIF